MNNEIDGVEFPSPGKPRKTKLNLIYKPLKPPFELRQCCDGWVVENGDGEAIIWTIHWRVARLLKRLLFLADWYNAKSVREDRR